MYKKITAIILVLLVSVTLMLGCSGDRYTKVDISDKQDTSYRVENNGSSAVTYGNYIYFINGTAGYEDTTGEANLFGDVIKGAMYRARLLGEKETAENGNVFSLKRDADSNLYLASTLEKDYKRDDIYVVDVQLIVPKIIGTSGHSSAIYIFDDYVYYASPHNQKDNVGNIRYLKTDFFRMKLDGTETKKLYTTAEETASNQYGFYYYNKNIFILTFEGTEVISIKINPTSGKTLEKKVLNIEDSAVTEVSFPVKPVYFNGITENTVYDFIYTKRNVMITDGATSGEILEFMRPDGSVLSTVDGVEYTRVVFTPIGGGTTYKLNGVYDGYMFYTMTPASSSGAAILKKTNLHDYLLAEVESYSKDYSAAVTLYGQKGDKTPFNEKLLANTNNVEEDAIPLTDKLANYTVTPYVARYDFMNPTTSNAAYVLAVESGTALLRYTSGSSSYETIATGSAIVVEGIQGGKVYYSDSASLNYVDMSAKPYSPVLVSSTFVSSATGVGFAGGYVVYFANVDDNDLSYTYFYEIDGLDGNNEAFLVGERIEDETPSITEKLEIYEMPDKVEYKIGEKFDWKGLVVYAYYYKDSNGNYEKDEDGNDIQYKEITDFTVGKNDDEFFSGFDSSAAGTSTVTITYDRKTVTFDVTILEETAGCGSYAGSIGGIAGIVALIAAGGAVLFTKKKKA